jgi:hypothetical protein
MAKGPLGRVVLILLAVFGFGIYLAWNGWRGWLTKEILVRGKFSPDYVAYAAGPHADTFLFEVWLRVGAGLLLVLLGAGCSLMLLLSPRRNEAIHAADSAFISGIKRKLMWFGALLLFAICVVVVTAVANGT